jgi:hypothetical protein
MKKIILWLFLVFSVMILINACRKDESNPSSGAGSGGSQIELTITGMVQDENAAPIPGVNVSGYGLTATTDQYGIFFLQGSVSKIRCILQLDKPGYMKRAHAFIPSASKVNYVRIVLSAEPLQQNISSSSGGTVSTGGSSVNFQANSFVIAGSSIPYVGTVNISFKHLSPSDGNFGLMIPGSDLSGFDASGNDATLYSYGMLNVQLKGSGGETLQLAAGATATITVPISASQMGAAPSDIPLWYFDESTSMWKEEGSATKVGNNYSGTVSHFTWWNYDYGYGRATVLGRVIDCEGVPLTNVSVTVNGGMTVVTDNAGYYTNWVPSGISLSFQVLPQGPITLPSQVETLGSATNGQSYTIPDLEVPCTSFMVGLLSGCNNQAVPGSAILLYNGVVQTHQYANDGNFKLMAPASSIVTINMVSSSGYASQEIMSSITSDSVNLGNIQLCYGINSSNSFVINGGGYNYETVNLNPTFNQTHYSPFWDHSTCQLSGYSNLGNIEIKLAFEGNQPVSFFLNSPFDSSFSIRIENNIYGVGFGGSDEFFVDVIHYGNIGDSITGTFHGDLFHNSLTDTIKIINGRFAFLRGQDW